MKVGEVRSMTDARRLIESRAGVGLRAVEIHLLQRMFDSVAESDEIASLIEELGVAVLSDEDAVR